jgi:hypothetical protein
MFSYRWMAARIEAPTTGRSAEIGDPKDSSKQAGVADAAGMKGWRSSVLK